LIYQSAIRTFYATFYRTRQTRALLRALYSKFIRGENDFAEVSTNLAKYESQNNFIKPPK